MIPYPPRRLDSTSHGITAEPYVTVLARRVMRARAILARDHGVGSTPHRWARQQLAEASDYLNSRTVRIDYNPTRKFKCPLT